MTTTTSQEMQVFNFNSEDIRVIQKDGEPWFVAKDVAILLGYTNPQKAIRDHCKGVNETDTPTTGGVQAIKIIPERDLYRLVMRSKLPAAEKFEDWVVGTVLPSIRKNGGYAVTLPDFTNAVEAARAWADSQEKLIESQQILEAQVTHIKEIEPKAKYTDDVLASKN